MAVFGLFPRMVRFNANANALVATQHDAFKFKLQVTKRASGQQVRWELIG